MPLLGSSTKGAGSWQRGWARHLDPQMHDESLKLVGDSPMSFRLRSEAPTLRVRAGPRFDPLIDLLLFVAADNAVTDDTAGVTFHLHVCRRGLQGRWPQTMRNDAVAETMMGQLRFDKLLLAYGTDGTGFEQPAFPSRDKTVVLGLVSTHDQRVETPDELVRSVETATAFINEDQLAIGPQCGFAGLSAIATFPRKRSGESSTP